MRSVRQGAYTRLEMVARDTSSRTAPARPERGALAFVPDRRITETELRRLLAKGSPEERSWAVSHLLRFARWEEIWSYVERDEVRRLLPSLDLPDGLRRAWSRYLGESRQRR